jgi:hypothetical protein
MLGRALRLKSGELAREVCMALLPLVTLGLRLTCLRLGCCHLRLQGGVVVRCVLCLCVQRGKLVA